MSRENLQTVENCRVTVTRCENPRCQSYDVRGPFDTPKQRGSFVVIRAWFCRVCQWSREIELLDAIGERKATAARKPSQAAR